MIHSDTPRTDIAITHSMGNTVLMLNDLPTERVLPALRFARLEASLSHEKLAELTGFSSSAVARRLSGDTPLTLDDLTRIASACGYEVTISLAPGDAA